MKRLFLILFFFLVSACLSSAPIPQDTLVIGIEQSPDQLDPRFAIDAMGSKIRDLVFSGLLDLDDTQDFIPELAQSYTIRDEKTYEFDLKENLFFHDGSLLTSEDVKATYLSMRHPENRSPYSGSLQVIETIETPSPQKIIFHLKKPYAPFLTLTTIGIVPKRLVDQNPISDSQLVGSGPYAFSEITENRIVLKRSPCFYGEKAKTETLLFRVVQDNTLRSLELLNGRIDLLQNNIPYVMVPFFQEKETLRFEKRTGINFSYLAFNFRNPYLKSRTVREAIALAIDREKIIRYKLKGLASLANSLLNPHHWVYDPRLGNFSLDLERAKQLLLEAGFPDPDGDGPQVRFSLTYKTSTDKVRLEIAQLIAENLRKIGIGVTIKSHEFGTFYRDIKQGNFDIYTLTWVGLFDPDIYYSVGHSEQIPPQGSNRGFYANKDLDQLVLQAQTEIDFGTRKKLYHEIQRIFYEDFAYVPLWYEDNFVFFNKRVQGYTLRSDASLKNIVFAYKK